MHPLLNMKNDNEDGPSSAAGTPYQRIQAILRKRSRGPLRVVDDSSDGEADGETV